MSGRFALALAAGLLAPLLGCKPGETNPCAEQDCSSRGFCVEDGAAYCACIPGYRPVGLTCVPLATAESCQGIDCSGHGSCRVLADGPTCDCAPGYRHVTGALCEGMECDLFCIPIRATDGDVVIDAPDEASEDVIDAPDEAPEDVVDESSLPPCEATYDRPTVSCGGATRYIRRTSTSIVAYCQSQGFESGYLVSEYRTSSAVCQWNGTSWSAFDSETNGAIGRATCTRSEPCAP